MSKDRHGRLEPVKESYLEDAQCTSCAVRPISQAVAQVTVAGKNNLVRISEPKVGAEYCTSASPGRSLSRMVE